MIFGYLYVYMHTPKGNVSATVCRCSLYKSDYNNLKGTHTIRIVNPTEIYQFEEHGQYISVFAVV